MAAHEVVRGVVNRWLPVCRRTNFWGVFRQDLFCSSSAPGRGEEQQEVASTHKDDLAGSLGPEAIMTGAEIGGSGQSHIGHHPGIEEEGEGLDVTRARVFGYHVGNGLRSGRKVLRKKLVGAKIAGYYIDPIKDPLLLNLKHEAAKLKLSNLRRRGKGPPKKGQGKRTKK